MKVTITWFENAAFEVRGLGGQVIILDPGQLGRPTCPKRPSEITEADLVCVTHGDPGHFNNSTDIASRTGAFFVSSEALCDYVRRKGLVSSEKIMAIPLNQFREVSGIKISMYEVNHPPIEMPPSEIPNQPNCGFIVKGNGLTIVHAGDVAPDPVFEQIGSQEQVDIALIPTTHFSPPEATANALQMIKALRPRIVYLADTYANAQQIWPLLLPQLTTEQPSVQLITNALNAARSFDLL